MFPKPKQKVIVLFNPENKIKIKKKYRLDFHKTSVLLFPTLCLLLTDLCYSMILQTTNT